MSNELTIYEENNSIRHYLDTENGTTKALAIQCKKFIPGIDKLPPEAQWAFAAICLAYDVDPTNKEAWAWVDNKNNPVMMIGIAGRRRKAREQLRKETGDSTADYMTEFERVDSALYGMEKDDFVYECKLYDTKSSQRWLGEYVKMKLAGFDSADAERIIGKRPFTLGVGICKKDALTKMEKNEAARKRAEANALKQRFDLRMPDVASEIALNGNGDSAMYEKLLEVKAEERRTVTAKSINEAFGFEPATNATVDEIIEMAEDESEETKTTPVPETTTVHPRHIRPYAPKTLLAWLEKASTKCEPADNSMEDKMLDALFNMAGKDEDKFNALHSKIFSRPDLGDTYQAAVYHWLHPKNEADLKLVQDEINQLMA